MSSWAKKDDWDPKYDWDAKYGSDSKYGWDAKYDKDTQYDKDMQYDKDTQFEKDAWDRGMALLCECAAGRREQATTEEVQLYEKVCDVLAEKEKGVSSDFSGKDEHPGPFQEWLYASDLAIVVQIAGVIGMALAFLSVLRLLWKQRRRLRCRFGREPTSEALQEKLLEYKVGQMRSLLSISCFLLLPITAWSVFKVLNRSLLICLAQNLLALFALFPGLVQKRSLEAVYCGCSLLVIAGTSPMACCDDDLLPSLCVLNLAMMALVSVRRTMPRRFPLLLLVNAAFGAASASLILSSPTTPLWREYAAAGQLAVVLLMSLGAPLLEGLCQSFIGKLMEVEELQGLLAASQSLLRSCFDVVVELDATGQIVSTGPELGALLLRDRQCMQGQSFAELVEEEELREGFSQRLAASLMKDLGLAESMQLSVRDACGNSLSLELMWLPFKRPGSRERRYMLGLREATEQAFRSPRQSSVRVAVPQQDGSRTLPVELAVSDSDLVPEAQSVSSGSCVDGGAVVVLDWSNDGLPVQKLSRPFRMRLGRMRRGTSFLKVLKRPEKFEDWLFEALVAKSRGTRPPADSRVTFKFPQGKYSAYCCLIAEPRGSDDEGEEREQDIRMDRVAVLFYEIRGLAEHEERRAGQLLRGTTPSSPASSLPAKQVQEL